MASAPTPTTDAFHFGVAGCEHDDGHIGEAPHLLAHLEAIHVGQHDVQQNEVGRLGLDGGQRLFAVLGGEDLCLRPSHVEAKADYFYNVGLVVNNQYLQNRSCQARG
jgi:hypothetical protein